MKGKQLNDILYVFDATVGEIPYVASNVTVIYVQQEQLAAWKTANSSYASLMQPYNYKMLVVNKLEWADYTNEDIVLPTHNITVPSGTEYINVAATAQYQSTVIISPKSGYSVESVNIASSNVEITAGEGFWTFTMPDEDVSIVAGLDLHNITLTRGANYVELSSETGIAGETMTITPVSGYTVENINVTSSDVEIITGVSDWTFTMPDNNIVIVAVLDTHIITLTGDTTYVDLSANTAISGETITVTPTDASQFSDISLSSQGITFTESSSTWTFTMPDNNVSIVVTYTEPQPAVVNNIDGVMHWPTELGDYLTFAFADGTSSLDNNDNTLDPNYLGQNGWGNVFYDLEPYTLNGISASVEGYEPEIISNGTDTLYLYIEYPAHIDRASSTGNAVYTLVKTDYYDYMTADLHIVQEGGSMHTTVGDSLRLDYSASNGTLRATNYELDSNNVGQLLYDIMSGEGTMNGVAAYVLETAPDELTITNGTDTLTITNNGNDWTRSTSSTPQRFTIIRTS